MKTKLLDSQNLQHFLSKSQALNSWAKMMMDGLSSDKLAKDVAEAKELLAAHQVMEAVDSCTLSLVKVYMVSVSV